MLKDMLPIKKNHTPPGLLNYKRDSAKPTYKEFSENINFKAAFLELRKSLVEEQRFLCCYCLQSIELGDIENAKPKMKTEHFLPKDENKYPQHQLDYKNLLAACLGNENQPEKEKHCDVTKGNNELRFLKNPALKSFQKVLDYQVLPRQQEVRIVPSPSFKENKELIQDIKLLNLNEQSLRSRRFTIWKKICLSIGIKEDTDWQLDTKSIRILHEKLEAYRPDETKTKYMEFSDFIISWFSERFSQEAKR